MRSMYSRPAPPDGHRPGIGRQAGARHSRRPSPAAAGASIEGAKGVLVNITAGQLPDGRVRRITRLIRDDRPNRRISSPAWWLTNVRRRGEGDGGSHRLRGSAPQTNRHHPDRGSRARAPGGSRRAAAGATGGLAVATPVRLAATAIQRGAAARSAAARGRGAAKAGVEHGGRAAGGTGGHQGDGGGPLRRTGVPAPRPVEAAAPTRG